MTLMRRILLTSIIAPLTSALTCAAQEPIQNVDQIANWPAPLYWQPASGHSAVSEHHGRIREETAVKAGAATPGTPAVFVAISPCRVIETRNPDGPYGGPAFAAGETRTYTIPSGPCVGLPASAVAFSVNIAVIPLGTQMKWLTAWDTGSPQPHASTLNDYTGQIASNSAVVPASTGGEINIFVTDPTQVIVDINGYYAPPDTFPMIGTAAVPALTFGDTTTGLYSDTAGTVSIATGGTSRLTVRSDGDLELPGSIRKGGVLFAHNLGFHDTALGLGALALASSGNGPNTAIGFNALTVNTTGYYNTALGSLSMQGNTTGYNNTVVGRAALAGNIKGCCNTALGYNAGYNTPDGSYNVYIANQGVSTSESNTIRIGDVQTQTFLAGIRGITTSKSDAVAVVIDSNGQLGTASSSRRVKRDIEDMGDTTGTILALHPVRFRYQAHGPDSPFQYGLIAEEVAEVATDLVAHNKDGEIETVHYDKVNAMLLNEVQRLTREKDALADTVRGLETRLAALEDKAK
jgi:hypothetical protein